MKRRRRFAEGDLVEEGLGAFDSDTASYARRAPQNRTIDDMSFSEAFKAKRKELGEGKTFTWRGEKYTTSTKKPEAKVESKPATTKPAPKAVTKPLTPKQEKTVGRQIDKSVSRLPSLPGDRATDYRGADKPEDRQRLKDSAIGVIEKGMKAANVPLHYRAFAGTMLGSKGKITEDYLTKDELAKLKSRTEKAASEGKSSIDYGKNKENINPVLNEDAQFGREKDIELTFGRAGFKKDKDKTVLRDKYEFNNPERRKELDRLKEVRKKGGKSAVVKDVAEKTLKDYKKEGFKTAFNRLPSRLGNAFIGEDGREVEIAMRRGGRVKEERVRGYGIAQKGRGRGRFVR